MVLGAFVPCASLLIATTVAASSEPVYWAPLPSPGVAISDAAVRHGRIVVLAEDGSLHEWDGREWSRLAPSPPGAGAAPTALTVAPDGTIWVCTTHKAETFGFSDEWSERMPLPGGYVSRMSVAPDGEVWAVGLHGYIARGGPDDWHQLDDPDLEQTAEFNVDRLVFDGHGVGWAETRAGHVLRVVGDEVVPVDVEAGRGARVTVDAAGRALLLDTVVRWLGPPGAPVVLDRPATALVDGDHGWWIVSGGEVWWTDGETSRPAPLPTEAPPVWLRRLDGETLVAGDAAGALFVGRRGRAPVLRDVAATWGVASLTDRRGVAVGDVDGDGLDDLAVISDAGRLRLLLQRDGTFDDATARLGLDVAPWHDTVVLCDLDGDGRADIVAREADPRGDGTVSRLRYLRSLDGWMDDATDTLPAPLPFAVTNGRGLPTCDDVDGDGDLDLLVPGGGETNLSGANVALFENAGCGRLRLVDLPERGLGQGRAWVQQVLSDDLDGDGWRDFILLNLWNEGHNVYRGLPGFRLQEATRGSGLDALYSGLSHGFLATIDGDDLPDLLVIERQDTPRVYRNMGRLRFEDRTQDWGLGAMGVWAQATRVSAEFADLDGDGRRDLVLANGRDGLQLALGSRDGAFVLRSDALPAATRGTLGLATLDLGGDGDLDLLVVRKGTDLLLENLADRVGAGPSRATRSAVRSAGWVRRIAWARPWPDGVAAVALMLVWLAAALVVRRAGSRVVLGGGWGAAAALGLGGAGYLALMELPPWWRDLAVAASVGTAALGGWAEITWDRWRKARRVGGYRLLERIGTGGMGTVYRARASVGGSDVALKLIDPALLARTEDRELFRREARIGASIQDRRVVRILAYGEWTVVDGGRRLPTAYLVMDLLGGTTLRRYLESTGPLDVARSCAVAREVALALDTVHGAGIVHRDIKPENLMLPGDGRVVLMDFGAARQVGHLTRSTRQVLGTMGYMAPEQGRGLTPDTRSDLFSLGVVLYEALAGHRPFVSDDLIELLSMLLYDEPRPLTEVRGDVPEDLDRIVRRALAKKPEDRFDDAAQLARALEPFCGALPDVPHRPAARTRRRADVEPGEQAREPLTAAPPTGGTATSARLALRVLRAWWSWSRRGGDDELAAMAATLLEGASRDDLDHERLSRQLERLRRTLGGGEGVGTEVDEAVPRGDAGDDRP